MLFSCVFVIFHYVVPGQVWYLIVSVPDLCFPYTLSRCLVLFRGMLFFSFFFCIKWNVELIWFTVSYSGGQH